MKMLESYFHEITGKIHPRVLKDLLPMEVTPACKWFLAESEQEHWDYTDDFPCLVPPSPITWLEYEAPDRISSSERTVENHQLRRAGMLAITYEIAPDMRRQALADDLLLKYMQMLDGGQRREIRWEGDRDYRLNWAMKAAEQGKYPRWLTCWNIILEPINSRDIVTLGIYGMYLDEQGRCIKGLNSVISSLTAELINDLPEDIDLFTDALPFMFALSLTHCKNVTTSDVEVPAAVAKKRAKKNLPSFTYRILDINPMRQASRKPSANNNSEGARNAMHFVRGHMKTFSADKPLFGKHSGTYWWHLQLRGDETAGVADKSYRVLPA